MRKPSRLLLEQLEDRFTPAGSIWPNPGHLSVSFVPDGTQVEDAPSSLFQTMGGLNTSSAWQTAILKAVQTWAVNTNVNVGLIYDSALPLGWSGALQSDPRFGDIRFASKPMASTAVATATQFNWSGTTWAGDVLFNSGFSYGMNGTGQYDLYTIALHEAGHIFGLDDGDTDTTSAMYENFLYPRTSPNAQDIANLQARYGLRSPDSFDAAAANNTLGSASRPSGLAWEGDITTANDVDYYKVTVPLTLGSTSLTVKVKTSGVSLLVPKMSVYDSNGQLVNSVAATSALNGDVSLTLNNVRWGASYYVRVEGNSPDVFGRGGYQVILSYQSMLGTITGVVTSTLANIAGHVNDTLGNATLLLPAFPNTHDDRFDYYYQAGLIDSSDQDYYQIRTPNDVASYSMHVLAWEMMPNGLSPVVHVFDANGNGVPVQVIANQDGLYSIQVDGMAPDRTYYLDVAAREAGNHDTGSYSLGVKFDASDTPITLSSLDRGSVDPTAAPVTGSLSFPQNGLFHFVVGAVADNSSVAALVTFSIVDARGREVVHLDAPTRQPPRTVVVYLTAGNYAVRYTVRSTNGTAAPVLRYWVKIAGFSDPIGPYRSDSTPSSTAPPSDGGGYAYAGGGSPTPSSGSSDPVYY